MAFYKDLSDVYDIVFPLNKNTADFISKNLVNGGKVLDLACGSGNYSIELAKRENIVIGIDLDEDMINKAKNKAGQYNEQVQFYCNDMMSFKDVVKDESFDMIVCIGNSIVHLHDKDSIKKILKDCYTSLNKGGSMIIQTINYDRIIKRDITMLPTIDKSNEGVQFFRNYAIHEDKTKVEFITKLIIKDDMDEEIHENSVTLLALTSSQLVKMLNEVGFNDVRLFGSFNEDDYNIDSYALVIKATVD